ncbi:hypothetical protein FHX42_004717 [Saccharopolyspora lacisalsi]|uniref:Uncharacterized protein n=1 Tax=Halosaccharopolyspora lacisalsi TaxID=1000566 RepID=A0A839E249_9PSEU|nr:hypothetical protein [Halosaccharopolyspora lacisalsi]MBA8827333.1 hypothetical protein [Halosaccharopolyspora lacisalsi]
MADDREPDYYWRDKYGRTRPGYKPKGRGGVAAAAVAIAVAASGGGLGGLGGLGATSTEGAAGSAVSRTVQVRVSKAKRAANKGQRAKAWKRMRLKVKHRRKPRYDPKCAAHSFGQVQGFFVHTPCRSLRRTLVGLADEHGNTGVVSIAWVRMSGGGSAARLKRLDDVQGTGDVHPLAGWALTSRGIRLTGEHYDSRRKRSLLVRAEAAAASGSMDPGLLQGAAEVAKRFPPP